MTDGFSTRTPQQALAALLERYAPQRLLLLGASELPALSAFQQAHPDNLIAHAAPGPLPAELAAQRFDLALVADCLEHLPKKTGLELLGGIHAYLAGQWESQLEDELGGAADTGTAQERLVAYARVSTQAATRAELMLQLEAAFTAHSAPWSAVLERWTTPANVAVAAGPMDHIIARLAADGLWMYETLGGTGLDDATRAAIVEHLAQMIEQAPPPST